MEFKKDTTYEKALNDFKIYQIDMAREYLIKKGEVMPIISVLCFSEENGYGAVVAPILGEINEKYGRDIIIENIIPEVFSDIKEKNLKPVCFSFSSEAWIRQSLIESDLSKDEIKDLPKEEALIMFIESLEESFLNVYIIERNGSAINSDGDMVDNIVLTPHDMNQTSGGTFSGRFTGILKKYIDEE